MPPLPVAGHAYLAVLLLLGAPLPARLRARLVEITAFAGIFLALWLVLDEAGGAWRSAGAGPGASAHVVAGAGVACAWLLVVALDRGRGRWASAALVGTASSALIVAALAGWAAPALLFWLAGSVAIAALALDAASPGQAWAAIFLSDVALVTGIAAHALGTETWALEAPVSGWPRWAIVGAAVVRAGALPRIGPWGLLASRAAPGLPLLLAGAFTLASPRLTGGSAGLALALLAAALAWALGAGLSRAPGLSLAGAWPPALALALSFAEPRATASAGVAAILAVSALALWPSAAGRGQAERGLLVAFLPLTAGFGALLLAAGGASRHAAATGAIAEALPWLAIVALVPVATAAGLAAGMRIGRQAEPEAFDPRALVATRALLAASALVAVVAPRGIGAASPARAVSLYVAAVALGALAAVGLARLRAPAIGESLPPGEIEEPYHARLWPAARDIEGPLRWAAFAFALAALAGAVAFTYHGLDVGFL